MGSMFGNDGLERMNKTLKQQLQDRDARLSVLERNLRDKEATLQEKTKQSDIESGRATDAEERATKAEAALELSTHELQRAKLNVSNLEESLRGEHKRRDELDREVKRLEYELQYGAAATTSSQAVGNDEKLHARIKVLETELHRKDSELAQTRAAVEANKARQGPANDFSAHGSRGGRRRASFVSSGQVADLTTERDAAAEAARTSQAEVDTIKAQRDRAYLERDKAVNSQMATEKRTKKEIEMLQEKIDDLRFELDDSGGDSSATDKIRADLKTAQAHVNELKALVGEKDKEIERLQSAPTPVVDQEEIGSLKRQITALESDLEVARSAPTPTAAAPGTSHLQRELKSAQRRIEQKEREVQDLKKDLQEVEDENDALRQGGGAGSNNDDVRVTQLQDDLSTAQDALAGERSIKAELEIRLTQATEEVQSAQDEIRTLKASIEAMSTQQEDATARLTQAHEAVSQAQARMSELETASGTVQNQLADMETSLTTARENVAVVEGERDAFKSELETKMAALSAAQEAHQKLSLELERHTASSGDTEELRRRLEEKEQHAANLEEQLASSAKSETDLASTRQQLERSQDMVEALKTELIDMESQLNEELDEVRAELAEKEKQLEVVREDLTRAVADHQATHSHIKALEEEIASRDENAEERNAEADKSAKAKEEVDLLRFELDNANDVMAKAAHEAAERSSTIATLEATVLQLQGDMAAQVSERASFEQMSHTIQRLRAERDEIQGQLSFVTHERHFQIQAATDEKSAVERELRDTLDSLRQKTALYDNLKSQQDELATRVAALQTEAAVSTTRVTSLEDEREVMTKDAAELEDKTVTLRKGLEAAAKRAEEERTKRREAEDRAEAAELAVPASEEERKKHLDELYARVHRREQRIKNMSADYKKLQANHSLAAEDLKEMGEELEAARAQNIALGEQVQRERLELDDARRQLAETEERVAALKEQTAAVSDTLNRDYDDLKTEKDSLAAAHGVLQETHAAVSADRDAHASQAQATMVELEAAQALLTEQKARVATLENSLATAIEDARTLAASNDVRDLVLAIAVQFQAVRAATDHAHVSEAAMRTALAKVGALEDEQVVLFEQASQVGRIREELESARDALSLAEARGATSEEHAAKLLESEGTRAELQHRIDTLETALAEVTDQFVGKEQDLAAARDEHETALVDLEDQLESAASTAQQNAEDAATKLATAQSEIDNLTASVAEITTALESAQEDLKAVREDLDRVSSDATTAEGSIATLRADVARLESELATMTAERDDHLARADELVSELSLAKADQAALATQLDDVTASLDAMMATEASLRAELETANAALEEQTQAAIEARTAAEVAEREAKSVSSHFRFMEKQKDELSARVTALREELATAQAAAESANAGNEGSTAELSRLVQENKALQQQVSELQEDLERATDSLTYKTNEVDEADDRALELNKEITRLRKRADKLDRQNKAITTELETMRNTMQNTSPPRKSAAAMAPPPVPATLPAITVAPPAPEPSPARVSLAAATAGTPARSFNVFSGTPSQDQHQVRAPNSGTKRAREDDDDERHNSVEARVQPGPGHKVGRSPFASRGNEGHHRVERPLSAKKSSTTAERMFAAHKAAVHAQKSATPGDKGSENDRGEVRSAFAPGNNAFAQ
ncbi:uncharacterized protein EHS24_000218 [Apiotrichum porosum]|uniref:Uncharacterized protein n=1 Tax=Apiotrichum porosum TaxID=105984 RepID=A0A427Y9A7_9TREE|nr:uncharacterized protein EHS24_000218 [Apiotrichum porosum]RSH87702.1 hypothetical protein EHS24_000218 [Apiotrichum porosum]